jgi:hypothetical protein
VRFQLTLAPGTRTSSTCRGTSRWPTGSTTGWSRCPWASTGTSCAPSLRRPLYHLKELPRRYAEREWRFLRHLEEEGVPVVDVVGVVSLRDDDRTGSGWTRC